MIEATKARTGNADRTDASLRVVDFNPDNPAASLVEKPEYAKPKDNTMNPVVQSAKDLVGSWTLVSYERTTPDGKKDQPFGPNPHGIMMFDAGGRYSRQIMRGGKAKFASNDRTKSTPEENRTVLPNNNSHFGKYSIDEANHAIVFKIENAIFPNLEGTVEKRPFTITGDELKYTVPAPSVGSGVSELVWKRAN